MDADEVEIAIAEVTGELAPFDYQEEIVDNFGKRVDKTMSLRTFIAAWRGVSCAPALCVTAAADDDDDNTVSLAAEGAPSAVTMNNTTCINSDDSTPTDATSSQNSPAIGCATDFVSAALADYDTTQTSYLDVRHLVEAAAGAAVVVDDGDASAATASAHGMMKAFDASLAPYAGFGANAVPVRTLAVIDADGIADDLFDAASALEDAAAVALAGPTPMSDAQHVAPYLRAGTSADDILSNGSSEFLTDLYRAARTASGSEDGEDGVTLFDDTKLRATSRRDAQSFQSAALGLADHLRRTTLDHQEEVAIGDKAQSFELKLGRTWGSAILAIVGKLQIPYASQEVMEYTATYTLDVRHALVRNIVERGSGAMNHAFEAVMQMAGIIVTQTAVTLRQRGGGQAYMTKLRDEMRDVLAVSAGATTEDAAAIKAVTNPFNTRSQLLKGLKTLVDEASAKSPVDAVRRTAALTTNGFLKVFAEKWSTSVSTDKKYYRDTAGLYASGVIGMLLMRDMATLAATFDNLADAWREAGVPYMVMAIRTLQF